MLWAPALELSGCGRRYARVVMSRHRWRRYSWMPAAPAADVTTDGGERDDADPTMAPDERPAGHGGANGESAHVTGSAASRADHVDDPVDEIAEQAATSARETSRLVEDGVRREDGDPAATRPGTPFNRRSPFYVGFLAALGVLVAYGLVHVVLQLTQVLTFVVLALFLSLGLDPIVSALNRRGMPRGWSVFVVVVTLAGVFALIGWVIVPPVIDQSTQLVNDAPGYVDRLQHTHLVKQLDRRWHVTDRAQKGLQSHLNAGTASSLFGGVLGAGKAIVDGVVAAFTVLVLTLYFLAAMPRVKSVAYQLAPRSRRPRIVYLSEEIFRRVGGYVLGQLSVASINGALSYLILAILGLPLAAVLAVLVGLLALVPIVGTLVGGAIVTLVALASSWQEALIVLGYYVLYHLIEAYLLAPRIMRRVVEVPPVVTIVAILAGGALLGILGALIAIPVAAGLILIYEQVLVPRQQRA